MLAAVVRRAVMMTVTMAVRMLELRQDEEGVDGARPATVGGIHLPGK